MANHVISNPQYARMNYNLRMAISRRGVSASWVPTVQAAAQPLKGLEAFEELSTTSGDRGFDVGSSKRFTASITDFDESETFPRHGILTIGGENWRVETVTVSAVSVVFNLMETGV